nr:CPBP family intramembrane metalloprotease [Clostridia bacterium]
MDCFNGAKRGGFIYTATLILFLIVALIGRTVLAAFNASETLSYAVNGVLTFAVFITVVLLSTKKRVITVYVRKCSCGYFLAAVMLAFGMLLGLGFVNSIVADGVKSVGGRIAQDPDILNSTFEFILFTIVLCVLPAVGEELFFRGVIAESVSKTGKVAGVLTVALCFAVYHGSVSQLLYQFIYGLGLGVLALKAKSVVPTVLAHFINNFAVLSMEYFSVPLDLFNPIVISVGAVLLAGFAAIIFVPKKQSAGAEKTESIKEFYLPFGIIGIGAAVLTIILSALPL